MLVNSLPCELLVPKILASGSIYTLDFGVHSKILAPVRARLALPKGDFPNICFGRTYLKETSLSFKNAASTILDSANELKLLCQKSKLPLLVFTLVFGVNTPGDVSITEFG